jgi:hypothetical protein
MSAKSGAHFERGSTFYQGGTIDSNNLLGDNILGTVKEFPDINFAQAGSDNNLTGGTVTCIALRNTTGSALLPKDVIKPDTLLPFKNASAKSSAVAQWFGVVDEYLPSGGVPANDIFWCVVKGPTTAKGVTVSGAQAAGMLPVGTSGTAGKLDFTPLTAATAILAQNQAAYGYNAVTEGAILDQATEYRIIINRNPWGL